jgi:predicted RNase H-like HicB family nuclease
MMTFQIEFDREEDGRWIAEIPKSPSAIAYGMTKEEAAANAEAIALEAVDESLQGS